MKEHMGQKQIKRERKALRTLFKTLAPIIPDAMEELEGDEELFMKWATIASFILQVIPNLSVYKVLPSRLDETIKQHEGTFLTMDQIENRP